MMTTGLGAIEVTKKMSPEMYRKIEEFCKKNDVLYVSMFICQAIAEKLTKRRSRPKKAMIRNERPLCQMKKYW